MKHENKWLGSCLGLFLLSGCIFYGAGSRGDEDRVSIPSNPDGHYWTNVAEVFMACKTAEVSHRAFCAGFLAGVDDTLTLLQVQKVHCASDHVAMRNYAKAFLAYVDEHPDVLRQAGSRGVALALQAGFACDGYGTPVEPEPAAPPSPTY